MTYTLDELRQRYLCAQLAGDRREAVRIVAYDGIECGHDVAALRAQVIQAAQQQIGAMWQRNEVSIAQEHIASAISQVALAALFERAPHAPRRGKTVVIACVEGEHHDLPARFVVDHLELEGYDVTFLGADVAHDHLVELVKTVCPDAVGLSVTMSFNLPSVRVAIDKLRVAGVTKIVVGGHATSWSRTALEGMGVEVVESVRDLVGAI